MILTTDDPAVWLQWHLDMLCIGLIIMGILGSIWAVWQVWKRMIGR